MNYQPVIYHKLPYALYLGHDRGCRMHWHSEMELLICLQGITRIHWEEQEFLLQPGDAILLPGYAVHATSAESQDQLRMAVNFGFSMLQSGFEIICHLHRLIPAGEDSAIGQIMADFCQLFWAKKLLSPDYEWIVRSYLYLLCGQLRLIASTQEPTETLHRRVRRLANLYEVLDYVASHYHERITVEQMATMTGYTTTYFCRYFKSNIGIPFYRYLTSYRIRISCQLLDENCHSISAVAEQTGFSSLPLFCRAFRQITGMTPSDYQKLSPEDKSSLL